MSESKLDLSKAIFDKIEEIGPDAAAAFFGRTAATVRKWAAGTAQPDVSAAQRILDEVLDSGALELPVFEKKPEQGLTRPPEDENAPEPPKKSTVGDTTQKLAPVEPVKRMEAAKKFSILTPINRDMSYATVLSMLGNWKATLPAELRPLLSTMDFEPDTLIHHARNVLATRFLSSGNEWSFWMDSDIIAPIGNPAWFKRRTGTKYADRWFTQAALEKLTARGKTVIGAVYCERGNGGKIVAQPWLAPKDEGDKKTAEEIARTGPEDKLLPVGWLGFGCVAVHRKVFEDIIAKNPDVKPKKEGQPYQFFTAFEGGAQNEDVAFCRRAFEAGHQPFLDLSIWCGHVGKFAFMP